MPHRSSGRNRKRALITGVTGQDGSYLAELLIAKGYSVYGLVRRASSFNTGRIDGIIEKYAPERFTWRRGDMTDEASLTKALLEIRPDEIYDLAAQSHVKVSFEIPVYTADVDALGTFRLLEAVRSSGLNSRIYHASSSEMFGSSPAPQAENTVFKPRSPYAISKLAAHQICGNYREAYGMWISSGIMFNHESPRRGETFVTRKITRAVSRIALGAKRNFSLGNLESKRDWGFAPEYVELMWRVLQLDHPDDFVISTGEAHTVREFVEKAFEEIGVELEWNGRGLEERGSIKRINRSDFLRTMRVGKRDVVVTVAQENFRATDVVDLLGDSSKARRVLGWNPKVRFRDLVKIMMRSDLQNTRLLLDGTRHHNEEWREFIV